MVRILPRGTSAAERTGAQQDRDLIGLNYKDQRADALAGPKDMGNPYETSLSDLDGRFGIEIGVYGVPETFVIDKEGVIHKHIGPLTPAALEQKLLPLIKDLS